MTIDLYKKDKLLWPFLNKKIIIFGNYKHFLGSILAKTLCQFNIEIIDGFRGFNYDGDNIFLKWDPIHCHSIENSKILKFPDCFINYNFKGNKKEIVHYWFYKTFGYQIAVDPDEIPDKIVVKSNENAKHDGKVIINPTLDDIKSSADRVCSILVDNTTEDGLFVRDIRIPIINFEIPFVYLKYKSIKMRFETDSSFSRLVEPLEALTTEEIKKIKLFCKEIKLDYGELDVLRDKNNLKIYIVDVNNTPYGPPRGLPKEDLNILFKRLFSAFFYAYG